MKGCKLPVLLLVLFSPLFLLRAQTPEGYLRSGFDGYQWWDGSRLFSMQNPAALTEDLPKKKSKVHKIPIGVKIRQLAKGVAYGIRRSDAEPDKLWICRSVDLEHWTNEAFFEKPGFRVLDFYPLENGRYLVAKLFEPWIKDGKASPWAVWQPNEQGKLELTSIEDGGLDLFDVRSVPDKEPGKPARPKAFPKPGKEFLPMELGLTTFTPVKEGVAVVWASQGKVLIFSEKNGAFRRMGTLFSSMEDPENAKKPKDLVFLGARPTQEGHLLIVSRTEDAVLHARAFFPSTAPLGREPEDPKAEEAAHNRALEAFPDILWWDFDPVTAHFVKLTPPQGMPDKLLKASTFQAFNFWMNLKNQPTLGR